MLDNAKKSRSDQLTINATRAINVVNQQLKALQPIPEEHINSILRGAINEMITSSADSLAYNFISSLSARHKQWEQRCDEHLLNRYKAIKALCSRESSDTAVNSLLDQAILECQQLATKGKGPINTFALDFIASDNFNATCFNNPDKVKSLVSRIQTLSQTTNEENASEEANQATPYSTQIEQAFAPNPYQKILDKITLASSNTRAATKKP